MRNTTLKNIYKYLTAMAVMLAVVVVVHANAFAADAQVTVNGGEDNHKSGESYTVYVTIAGSEQVGTYYVELEYDSQIASYSSGADSSAGSSLILTGTGTGNNVSYSLAFKNNSDGAAGVRIRGAVINDTEGSAMAVTSNAIGETEDLDIPAVGTIQNEAGQMLYILDQSEAVPDTIKWNYTKVSGTFQGQPVTYLTDAQENIHILSMVDGADNYYIYAVNEAGDIYQLNDMGDQNGNTWTYTSARAALSLPDKLAADEELADKVIYVIDKDGSGGFYAINENSELVAWDQGSSSSSGLKLWMLIAIIAAVVIVVLIILLIVLKNAGKRRKYDDWGGRKTQMAARSRARVKTVDPDTDDPDIDDDEEEDDTDIELLSIYMDEYELKNMLDAQERTEAAEESDGLLESERAGRHQEQAAGNERDFKPDISIELEPDPDSEQKIAEKINSVLMEYEQDRRSENGSGNSSGDESIELAMKRISAMMEEDADE